MTRHPLATALAVAFGWLPFHLPAAAETVLGTVSVEAEAPDDSPEETATITSITAEQLSRDMAGSIKDAVRYEPGVSVTNNPSRFGLAGFNIRGVDGNRVAMQIDGVRLPDEFKIGGYANTGRNLVDIALLKRIDIQRGSASTLYGSGALGGAVSYVTPDPEDWLADGRTVGGGIETQYFSANDAKALIPTLATGNDTIKFLVRGVRRSGTEQETKGTLDITGVNRTVANPQDDDLLSGLIKVSLTPNAANRTALTLEGYARDVATHVMSGIRGQTKDLATNDRYRRQRVSLDQRVAGLPFGTLDFKLYRQTSRTLQDTFDNRLTTNPMTSSLVERGFEQEQNILGMRLALHSLFEARGAHQLQSGVELSRRETIQIRTGQTLYPDRLSPFLEFNVDGFPYPARDYPPSTIDEFAVFAQDNWLLSDAWSAQLGFRYDRYKLTPEPDAIYTSANPLAEPGGLKTGAFSPKFGAVHRFGNGYALSAQYAWGFRAPPFDDVNIGFTNGTAYTAIPNPNLLSETSRGSEISLQRKHVAGDWRVTAFDTQYENFIDFETLNCPGDPLCVPTVVTTFQARNLDGVRIYGMEAGFTHTLSDRWRMRGSLAYARGRDGNGNPVDSVNPLTSVLGLIYTTSKYGIETTLSMASEKKTDDARRDANGSLQRQFLSDGYAVLDLRAHWQFAKTGRLSVGVLNLFDVKYALWADVPVADVHIADSSFGADRYTQPGRNFTLNLRYDF